MALGLSCQLPTTLSNYFVNYTHTDSTTVEPMDPVL